MALESVNTNMGAMVALQSLEATQQQLAVTQKEISTGYRVADSTDDGAAYAIAQSIRSTVGALTSANQQLGSAQGLLSTTQTALNNVSNMMGSMRDVLLKLSDDSLSTTERSSYIVQYQAMALNVKSDIQDAGYNGKSLIGDITGSIGGGTITSIDVPRNENAATYGVATMSGSAIYTGIDFTTTQLNAATTVASLIGTSANAVFITQQTNVGTYLNNIGSAINFVNSQTTYNNDKIDALNSGLGSLVDADLAKESAQLTALQIRQQLGTQALSLANQAPQSLLSLFK
jgi:flagellin